MCLALSNSKALNSITYSSYSEIFIKGEGIKIVGIIVLVLLLIVGAVVVWIGSPHGPSLDDVAHLQEPRIITLEAQKMVQVTTKGNLNTIGKKAFGLLFKSYFKLSGVSKRGPDFQPPRARWPLSADTSMEEWIGFYALPVPDTVTELLAVFVYLFDVFILPKYQNRGLGTWLMSCVLAHPELQEVKWGLSTKGTHGLYEKFGFRKLANSEKWMKMERTKHT